MDKKYLGEMQVKLMIALAQLNAETKKLEEQIKKLKEFVEKDSK